MNTTDLNLAKFTKSFEIGSFDTDFNGRAKITSICNYLQEVAGKHVDLIDQGMDDLKTNNLAWVLSRLKLKIYELPLWKNKINIETWSTGRDGLFGNRNFRIFDLNDKIIAEATSSWLIINLLSKRPVRPHQIVAKMPIISNDSVFNQSLKKINTDHIHDKFGDIEIKYSDIDINQHVNNVKYIKWLIDSCPVEIIRTHTIEDLEINFLHESKLGDYLEILRNNAIDSFQFVIKNKETNIENCKAIIKWKK